MLCLLSHRAGADAHKFAKVRLRRLRRTSQRLGGALVPVRQTLSLGRMQTLLPACSNRSERLEKNTRWRREGRQNWPGSLGMGGCPCLYAICLSYSTLFRSSKSGNRNYSACTGIATKFTETLVASIPRNWPDLARIRILAAGCLPLRPALRKMIRPQCFDGEHL